MKELFQGFKFDYLKLIDDSEEELTKIPEKKLLSKLEDLRSQCDENLLITLKTLICIYKQ